MLQFLKQYALELFTFICAAYGQASFLFCEDWNQLRGSTRSSSVLSYYPAYTPEASVRIHFTRIMVPFWWLCRGCYSRFTASGGWSRPCRTDVELYRDRTHLWWSMCSRCCALCGFRIISCITCGQTTLLGTLIGSVERRSTPSLWLSWRNSSSWERDCNTKMPY